MIEIDLPDICEHQYNYPYYAFIDQKIIRCDNACSPLSVMELKCVFKEWIRDCFPGYRYHFLELYELITKKFGTRVITKKMEGWVGIRMNCNYTEYDEDDFQTKDCMYQPIETKDCKDESDDCEIETKDCKEKDCKEKYKHYTLRIFKHCTPCEHGQCNKTYCKVCARLCEHGKCKSQCKECVRISQLCKHNIYKSHCKECGGYKLCRSSWCHTSGNKKYEGYCVPCFVNNPDNMFKPEMRNHKTKEKEVVDFIMENYPKFDWVADKKVQDGCSRRRPDLLLDMGSHIIIVEIDENKHTGYDCSCENKRLMEISQDLQHRPIVFIRFNPDSYRDQQGRLIKSCWQLNTRGVMTIILSKRNEWNERMQTLNQQIHHWIDNIPEKMVEIVELFY